MFSIDDDVVVVVVAGVVVVVVVVVADVADVVGCGIDGSCFGGSIVEGRTGGSVECEHGHEYEYGCEPVGFEPVGREHDHGRKHERDHVRANGWYPSGDPVRLVGPPSRRPVHCP